MTGLTDYTAKKVLDHIVGKTDMGSLPTGYIALFTAVGLDDGTGFTEVSGGNYSRVQTADTDWNAASGSAPSTNSNANDIEFPTPSADWGTVIAFGIYDAASEISRGFPQRFRARRLASSPRRGTAIRRTIPSCFRRSSVERRRRSRKAISPDYSRSFRRLATRSRPRMAPRPSTRVRLAAAWSARSRRKRSRPAWSQNSPAARPARSF